VAKSLNIRSSPSAFQIRYGGCKGVVSVCPDLEADQIHVRKSMEKFKSDHYELEMVTYTKPGNCQFIFLGRLLGIHGLRQSCNVFPCLAIVWQAVDQSSLVFDVASLSSLYSFSVSSSFGEVFDNRQSSAFYVPVIFQLIIQHLQTVSLAVIRVGCNVSSSTGFRSCNPLTVMKRVT